jgi:4-hydroxybenzoate polyprenyltransferase
MSIDMQPAGRLGKLLSLIRWYEWWYSKVGPQFLFVYLQISYRLHDPLYLPGTAYLTLLLLLISGCSAAAYGYLINDFFDKKVDECVGKRKLVATSSANRVRSILLVLIVCAVLPLLLLKSSGWVIMLLSLIFLAGTIYSAPPLRFKEHAVLGIVTASLAQRAIPTIFVSFGFADPVSLEFKGNLALIATGTLLNFMIGLRWILIHQLLDGDNDKLAQVRTFVTKYGAKPARRLLKYVCLPLEIIFLTSLLSMICRTGSALLPMLLPALLTAVAVYLCFLVARCRHDRNTAGKYRRLPLYAHAPDQLYEVWLPAGYAVALALSNPAFLGFVFLYLILFLHRQLPRRQPISLTTRG